MKRKRQLLVLIGLLALPWPSVEADTIPTNFTPSASVILIDSSSTSVGVIGKATLTIGALKREGEIFSGNYQVKVVPYSFKNEQGKLEIFVSDDSMGEIARGNKVAVTGTATTDKTGKTRSIAATATPTDKACGTLKISFIVGKKKTVFESAYHFVER